MAHIIYYATTLFLSATALLFVGQLLRQKRRLLPPGPMGLPVIGHLHLVGPFLHRTFHEWSLCHGPLIYVRLGSIPCVVASSPQLAKEMLKDNELAFTSRQTSGAIDLLTYKLSSVFSPIGPYWKFVKKLCTSELLGSRNLNHLLPIRTDEYHRFIRFLNEKSNAGECVNLTEELLSLSNNIISRMMLSIRYSGKDGQAQATRRLIREATQIIGEFNISDILWCCKNLDLQGFRRRSEDIHRRYDALLEKIIADREEVRKAKRSEVRHNIIGSGDNVMDFLDALLDVSEDDNAEMKLTRNHIKALVLEFFTAATETTAMTLEWALAELINNPKVLQKAREDIEKVVGYTRLVQESDGSHLPYIQAILKETFRLHPPLPLLPRKSVKACKINGFNIPADAIFFVNLWSIGRNPDYWVGPLDFHPERFLEPNNPIDVRGQHFQLLPFGTGRRGCVGMSLALLELPTILGAMIQCFDWKVAGLEGAMKLDMNERPGLTTPRAHDLLCVPIARALSFDLQVPSL